MIGLSSKTGKSLVIVAKVLDVFSGDCLKALESS